MKKLIALLLALAMLLSLAACGAPAPAATEPETTAPTEPETIPETEPEPTESADPNLIPGGRFDAPDPMWNIYTESFGEGNFAVNNGALTVNISRPGTVAHAVQIYADGFEMLKGAEYQLSFTVSSTVERTFEWRIQLNGGDYHAYAGEESVPAGPEATKLTYTFTMEEPSDPAPRFCFNLGDAKKEQGLAAHQLVFDDVELLLLDDSHAEGVETVTTAVEVNVNQAGYRPQDQKVAIFRTAPAGTAFDVLDAASGEAVFSGTTAEVPNGGSSGDTVSAGDFTALTAPGAYRIACENGESYAFTVAADAYDNLLKDTVKFLYLQRCGMELTEDLAGDFAHPICHTEPATILGTDTQIEVSGGWHDAGDYGRYTVPGAKAAADLLLAYEYNPQAFDDALGIPESGNRVPDILDEARWELVWLMKMQDSDGGVYHKVTGLNFDGTVMPQDCVEPLYIMEKSPAAAGDFAGVMYLAARVFAPFDPEFAAVCQEKADLSLSYIGDHYEDPGFKNPSSVSTGEYPDDCAADEYFWALCEGYKTTGDSVLEEAIANFDMSKFLADGLGWIDMSVYGYYACLTSGNSALANLCKAAFTAYAEEAKTNSEADSYGSSIADDYPWGSNMTIANNGMLMLMAEAALGDASFRDAAIAQLNYLLGVNTTSYCFVSGYGELCPQHPHHRPSQAMGKAMPGMLAGGPNNGLEDAYASQVLKGAPKAACYVDGDQSYSTNEVTIYWNSPFVFLLAGLI